MNWIEHTPRGIRRTVELAPAKTNWTTPIYYAKHVYPSRYIVNTGSLKVLAALSGSLFSHKVNPRDYLHWLFPKLPTVSAPEAGRFTPTAYAALRTQAAPVSAVA